MTIHRYRYRRPTAVSPPSADRLTSYTFPLPIELNYGYEMDYNTTSLGLSGAAAQNVTDRIRRESDGSIGSILRAAGAIATETGTGASQAVWNNPTGVAADALSYIALDTNAVAAGGIRGGVASALGMARNPFMAVLFNNPNFRKFDFSWKFVARSQQEATELENMLTSLRAAMHPTRGATIGSQTLLFNYPDIFNIEFPAERRLPKIAMCVCTSAALNYHGEGNIAWHNDGRPVSLGVSLSFSEAVILTSENIMEGF